MYACINDVTVNDDVTCERSHSMTIRQASTYVYTG
jgi:hypothetical protein